MESIPLSSNGHGNRITPRTAEGTTNGKRAATGGKKGKASGSDAKGLKVTTNSPALWDAFKDGSSGR